MDWLNNVWTWVLGILGTGTFVTTLTAIVTGIIKGSINKKIDTIDVSKIASDTTETAVAKIKEVSFKQNIQPLVESELKKINEYATEVIKTELDKVNANYLKIVDILDKLSAYFDDSIVVTDEKKQELKDAIEEAKNDIETNNTIETEEVVVTEENKSATTENSSKTNIVR